MRSSFDSAFVGFHRRYALRFFRQRRAWLLLVACCLGQGSVASAQILPTWTSNGPEGGTVFAVVIDPTTPTPLYAGTFGGGVFNSIDGGGTWTAVNTGLANTEVRALVIDPANPATVYAGTDGGGVFVFQ